MSTGAIIALAVVGLVLLAGVVVLTSLRRRDTGEAIGQLSGETRRRDRRRRAEVARSAAAPVVAPTGREVERSAEVERYQSAIEPAASAPPPTPWVPPDPETVGVARRQFLNRSIVAVFGLGLTGFGLSAIAFLWPTLRGGFGAPIKVGKITDILAAIDAGGGFYYVPEGRMWITRYPAAALPKAEAVYSEPELAGMREGVVALWQKCPHLGCRVPSCNTSKWFECPCHGSQYNQVGEKKGGPAPRGMDHFAMEVTSGELTVNTGTVINGPPIGTNTTGQEAEGPHCIGAGSH